MRRILPELPLIVMAEFEVADVEWIPYHIKRSLSENLQLIRARLGRRQVRISAVILDHKSPYKRLRWAGFRLAPARFLAFNENLDHFMLRPGSMPTIARHFIWRGKNFLSHHFLHGGFFYTWFWRLRQPSLLRRPFLYRMAIFMGWLACVLKAGSPKAPAPQLGRALPTGITVVIPSRNGRELLAAALPPIVAQLDEHSEIIVVDNGSDDGTADFLRTKYPAVAVELSDEPLSFASAVNRGIARARYSHTCLLNNDMVVETGFFAALQNAFTAVPGLFCASAQIFLPEGARREETGKTAFPQKRTREGFPVVCEVPIDGEDHTWVLYGSGGCSLYDTLRLRALGSVGEVFEPAYVEDLDLGFRAWRLNWPTVYVGGARVLHHHRTTTTRYYTEDQLMLVLERNYLRFLTRSVTDRALYRSLWRESVYRLNLTATYTPHYVDILQTALPAPGWIESQPPAVLPEAEVLALGSGDTASFPGRPAAAGRPRILVVSPYVPFPLSHGGAVRMYNLMSRAARDYDQVLVCFVDKLTTVPREVLDICAEVIYVQRKGTHALPSTERPEVVEEFDSPVFRAVLHQAIRKWKPAIAQLEFTQMAQYASDCAPAKTLLVEHDITLDLYAQLLRQNDDWELRRQFEKWVRFEQHAWGRLDRIVTMSEKDRRAVGRPNAVTLANGVDLERFQPSGREPDPRRILFIGSFQHLPNVLALDFFLRGAWPELSRMGAQLHVIAGTRPEYYLDRYKERVQPDLSLQGIEIEGFVADVRPAYERAAIVIAPLLASAGTNIKIMEAMAMSKAIVSTPAGINGLHELENGRDVIVVDTAEQMAAEITHLFENPDRRHELEQAARKTAEEKFDWDAIAREQSSIYRSLIGR